jgi:hypothetical protein
MTGLTADPAPEPDAPAVEADAGSAFGTLAISVLGALVAYAGIVCDLGRLWGAWP